jgi:hypothetical protein
MLNSETKSVKVFLVELLKKVWIKTGQLVGKVLPMQISDG